MNALFDGLLGRSDDILVLCLGIYLKIVQYQSVEQSKNVVVQGKVLFAEISVNVEIGVSCVIQNQVKAFEELILEAE